MPDFREKEGFVEELVSQEIIEQTIFMIRGHRVMLDKDLADLYRVDPRALR